MIIIPIPIQEPKCPSCGNNENKIEVCKHCGHEYENNGYTLIQIIVGIILIILIVWFLVTIMSWLFLSYDNPSLFEILRNQYEWFKSLKIK